MFVLLFYYKLSTWCRHLSCKISSFFICLQVIRLLWKAGITRLSIMALSYSASAFMDASIAASRGLGKTAVPTFVVVMGSCVFRIIWIYTIFAYFHTIQSLYILYVFSWGITAIAENIYFFHVYRHTLTGKTESHL